ncbi:family 43 glycosylhydrolase [Arthrobacter sp. EH-1B-1]|uniref:Family 43 glycosylhydrolase n=1 Tax=Arthrobacter vasquezii TaxID=2977629 RepID=A0ABT6CUA0_9MICC|nr:glycoside hydrolase family 43 protein [Arthrobacter vasquezii]MDF9277642.1 family 43 glycosylhydrolase [Arthrobacter vasquezii]
MSTPILPGYHPDPSICRVGDEYFLINSTFEYFPGVPVFSSRNLLDWQQIGHVLERESQLNVRTGIEGASGGIYAPTIRFHNGRFWMITTNLHDVRKGHLIVSAEHPSGPWSDPVYTPGLIGIDPDLAWDEEGKCYLTWSDVVRGGISQAQINPQTGQVLSEPHEIWRGTGGAHPEGPHIYAREGWWYLLAAEGGTAAGHMVTVARARTINGPYSANPANPILTHRSTPHPVQATGHGDLIELHDGSWAMVHLGTRPRGSFPKWHTNGRETFLVGIDWVDDWPVVVEDRFSASIVDTSFEDRFLEDRLHPRWISPGVAPASFAAPGNEGLALRAGRSPETAQAERLLAVRAVDLEWNVSVDGVGDLALVVRIDDLHQAILQRVENTVTARVIIGPTDQVLATRESVPEAESLTIRAVPFGGQPGERQGPDRVLLGVGRGDAFQELTSLDGRYLSTQTAGGFTGRVIGIEALAPGVLISRFEYNSLQD